MIRVNAVHPTKPRLLAIAGGCLLLLAAMAALAAYQRLQLTSELERQSVVLHRLASQRADQHDAHLTALSAIAVAVEERGFEPFLDVARTIVRFYPRIDDIELVRLDTAAGVAGLRPLEVGLADFVRRTALASDGQITVLAEPHRPGHYIMVKRSPNTAQARYGLMLAVDAARLIGDADPFWSRPQVALRLSLPDGTVLVDRSVPSEAIRFSRQLGSATQPLLLETGMNIGLPDLLPPLRTGLALLVVAIVYAGVLAGLRQRARTRAAMRQVHLSALESRLTHASRVNALGEMASGMAHELTQPLTAILAQAQAGRRLLERGDTAALAPVLEASVAQARRASAILERFRNWTKPQARPAARIDLRTVAVNVEALLAAQAAARGTRLSLAVPEKPVFVRADAVELEQVVFNLVRNALDATETVAGTGQVEVTLLIDGARAVLDVADNGPGVAEALRDRLFTPFTTTRPDGTGLGLALSQRLIERADGEISLRDGGRGAIFRVVLPLEREC